MEQAFRTREHHVITGRDGRPELLYDLERTQVFSIAPGGRSDAARAIETSLIDHEVVTSSPRPRPFVPSAQMAVEDVTLDIAGVCNMGCTYCFEADIGARRGSMTASTIDATIDLVFSKASDAGLVVQFASGEALTAFPRVVDAVQKFRRRAELAGVRLSFALTTNATLVTPEVAAFLADHRFKVKVSLDGPPEIHDRNRPMLGGQPSYQRVMQGLALLADRLPKAALTLNTVVRPDSSLGLLWDWVRSLPVGAWVTIPVGERLGCALPEQVERRRRDLERIADEIACAYETGREILEYEPLIKVVRKLAMPAPAVRYCGAAGSFIGVRSDGGVYPCLRQLGVEDHRIGDVWNGLDDSRRRDYLGDYAAPVDRRRGCNSCWARYLCGGGCYADSIVYGDDPRAPLGVKCTFIRLEIETALRLFDRLRASAPLAIVDLFGKTCAPLSTIKQRNSPGRSISLRRCNLCRVQPSELPRSARCCAVTGRTPHCASTGTEHALGGFPRLSPPC